MGANENDKPPSATELYANAVSHGSSGPAVLAAAFSSEVFGRRLVRLKFANESDEYNDALQTFRWMALGKNRKWKADAGQAGKLAKQVLDYWLVDVCPNCFGRGAVQIPDTPHLDRGCVPCNGSGKRTLDLLNEPEWGPRATELLGVLNDAINRFGATAAATLFPKE